MSVDGTPTDGSLVVPRDTPFVWTLQPGVGLIAVNDLAITTFVNGTVSLLPQSGLPSLEWNIGGIQPFPSTYRIWNTATDTYLTAPASVPGSLSATALSPESGLQYWAVAGTAVDSVDGTLQNVKTGAYVTVANGTVGGFSTANPSELGWLFSVVGGGDRLSYLFAPSPNVLALNPQGQVILDTQDSGNQQTFVFVPADPPSA
ncbi:hypothetical protein AURDEDRAFT_153991 [Auricularia subglabra TFB-10046 SS5]|nr:hypothetical protein AURDEDRAFT_153991 [Auricularia subglabra TFB-10046 SS5]